MASEHIKRNTFYTFVFNLSDSESVYAGVRLLQIDPVCARMLSSLPPGHCIGRQTQASWSHAFLCRMEYVAPARNLGTIHYDTHSFIPATDPKETEKIINQLLSQIQKQKEADKKEKTEKISDTEELAMKLLRQRALNPYMPFVRLVEKLGRIPREAQKVMRQYLETQGYALFEEPRIGRSNMLIIEITKKGYKALNLPIPTTKKGRGSLEHRHYAQWIRLFYKKQGFNADIEIILPGTTHPVDVALITENHWEIFEICVSITENLIDHVEACFDKATVDIKSLTIIASTKIKIKEIKKLIQSNLLLARYEHKIKLDVIENYMPKEFKK